MTKDFQNTAFHLLYEYSNYNANPSVIRQYVNNSWRTKEYIERLGIKMIQTQKLELEDIGNPKYADGFPPAIMHMVIFIWFLVVEKDTAVR